MSLVLTRMLGEQIRVGDIIVRVASIKGDRVRLAIDAPTDVAVHREEVYQRAMAERAEAAKLPAVGGAAADLVRGGVR